MPNHVVVIGSINVDAILHIQRLPQPGETIQMDAFSKAAGGKGPIKRLRRRDLALRPVSSGASGMMPMLLSCVASW